MKNKLFIILAMSIFLIGIVSAYEPHKQNTDLEFSFTSNNATQCNVTTTNTPDGVVTINQQSTKTGQTFNNTILAGNFTSLGNYCFNIVCIDGTNIETGNLCREINPSGIEINGWRISIQIFASLSTLFLMILFLFLSGRGLKSGMAKQEESSSKFFFIGLSFVFLIAHIMITNVIINDTLGELSAMAGVYTNVMYVFFVIIILMFVYTLIKVILWEVDLFMKKKGLK